MSLLPLTLLCAIVVILQYVGSRSFHAYLFVHLFVHLGSKASG